MSNVVDYVKGDYAGLARRLRNYGGQVFRFDAAEAIEDLMKQRAILSQELEHLRRQSLSSQSHNDPD